MSDTIARWLARKSSVIPDISISAYANCSLSDLGSELSFFDLFFFVLPHSFDPYILPSTFLI